nr:hypothetical protein BaRGS_023951 [Batillaria attramentaria]
MERKRCHEKIARGRYSALHSNVGGWKELMKMMNSKWGTSAQMHAIIIIVVIVIIIVIIIVITTVVV